MKHLAALLAVSGCLLLAVSPASAQSKSTALRKGLIEVSPNIGLSIPFGDFSNGANLGFAFGAQGAYYLSPKEAIGANLTYNTFGSDASGVSPSIWEITAMGKYLFPGSGRTMTPYVKADLGFYHSKVSVDTGFGTFSASSTDLGFAGGGGVQAPLSNSMGWFGEGMLVFDLTSGSTTNYLAFRGGLNFYLGSKGD